jgi:hypothetical protein
MCLENLRLPGVCAIRMNDSHCSTMPPQHGALYKRRRRRRRRRPMDE